MSWKEKQRRPSFSTRGVTGSERDLADNNTTVRIFASIGNEEASSAALEAQQTLGEPFPPVRVHEVVKSVVKEIDEYSDHRVEVPHETVVEKYVEVPIYKDVEVKYVPKLKINERPITVKRPEIKWVEKTVEVPEIRELVRYIESDNDIETIIKYVPIDEETEKYATAWSDSRNYMVSNFQSDNVSTGGTNLQYQPWNSYTTEGKNLNSLIPKQEETRFSQESHTDMQCTLEQYRDPNPQTNLQHPLFQREKSGSKNLTSDDLLQRIPVRIRVPVPFMAPKPVQVPVEVPVIKFRDHLIPVPVRRNIIPKVIFTNETVEVECIREKPVLIIEDKYKPVPVKAKIQLVEKDIKVTPLDISEISQSDNHAMWMRVNADLLEKCVQSAGFDPLKSSDSLGKISASAEKTQQERDDTEPKVREASEEPDSNALEETLAEDRPRGESGYDSPTQNAQLEPFSKDPSPFSENQKELDIGQMPLHPGHPLMMAMLQNKWMTCPTTMTTQMYDSSFFNLHASALDSMEHPLPHQANISQEQSLSFGPLPAQVLASQWNTICAFNNSRMKKTDLDSSVKGSKNSFCGLNIGC